MSLEGDKQGEVTQGGNISLDGQGSLLRRFHISQNLKAEKGRIEEKKNIFQKDIWQPICFRSTLIRRVN